MRWLQSVVSSAEQIVEAVMVELYMETHQLWVLCHQLASLGKGNCPYGSFFYC